MREFVCFNAFSHGRRSGNPLTVIANSNNLTSEDMQEIAREMSCPNTIFIGSDGLSCRIFARNRELSFSGHSLIGLAVFLARRDGLKDGEQRSYIPETMDGPARCKVTLRNGIWHSSLEAPSIPVNLGNLPPLGMLLSATGLSVNDIRQDILSPSRYRASHPYLYVPVKSIAALQTLKPDTAFMRRMFALFSDTTPALYVFALDENDKTRAQARMFSPSMGLAEDAATGAAAFGLAAVLNDAGVASEGENHMTIEQGHEIGRPSQIALSFTVTAKKLSHISISGQVFPTSEGRINA